MRMMRRLILRNRFSPGDVVMMTAAVRDLHWTYPGQFETDVRTASPELWENNPYLTPLEETDPGVEVLDCSYPLIDRCDWTPYHCLHGYIDFLNKKLDLAIEPTLFHGDIHLSALEKSWFSQVHELTGGDTPFWIVAAGGKYDVTIKWWEQRRYQEVVDHFRGRLQFVQIGSAGNHHPKLDGVIDLRGQTDLRELVRLVHHAQGVLCPVTLVMHLAAAVQTKSSAPPVRPCVVVAGGREPAHWEAYPGHQFIHTNGMLSCCAAGGCWKDRVLPLGDGDPRDEPDNLCLDVIQGLPRCMDLITSDEVVRRIAGYYEGKVLTRLSSAQAVQARRGVRESRRNDFDLQPLNLHGARQACDSFLQRLVPYCGNFHGRGIVICAGGVKYFTCAWVCINMLRRLGCRLPIQVWYQGKREMSPEMVEILGSLGARCVDALALRRRHPVRLLGGWPLKAYAMVHTSFREILFLDADNVPVRNPEYLFESPAYQSHGAVFWPDYGRHPRADVIWRSCGVLRPREPEFESGQMLVDKARCWTALQLSLWFNENADFYYRHLHGDKETFHLAFAKLGSSYALVPHPIHPLEGTMCQHDFEGRRLFQHRNLLKWRFHGPNKRVPDFCHEADCLRDLERLRELWGGRVRRRASPAGTEPRNNGAAKPVLCLPERRRSARRQLSGAEKTLPQKSRQATT